MRSAVLCSVLSPTLTRTRVFFFSSRRRHTRWPRDWSSDVCSSDLIDEAYFLHRPESERDYGQEAIEILLQAMEADRDKLVVILAGYRDRMEAFFRSNPGMQSRVGIHVHFP